MTLWLSAWLLTFATWRLGEPVKREPYDVMFYLPSVTPLLDGGRSRPGGGAETQVILLARALARRGYKVCLVTYPSEPALPSTIDGVHIIVRSASKADQPFVGKLREAGRIARSILRGDASVVVARLAGQQVGLVALSAKLRRRRFVYSSSSILDFDFPALRLKQRDLALYRLGLRLASELVVQTEEQAVLCRRRLGRSAVLIRSVAELVPERTAAAEAFVWIGRVDSNKRPLAFVELARSLPEARFWMVPVRSVREGWLLDEVERAAATVPNLELLEPRPRAQLMELVERAVAVVSTSKFEGMPNTFLEGWTRGVPALALSHDPDGVIGRHGLGEFAGGSRERLVAGARRLWAGRADQRDLSACCRRYIASEHSEEVVMGQWERALGISASVSARLVLEGVA